MFFLPLLGCGNEAPEVSPEDGARVAQVARPAAAELLRTLVGRLTSALEEEGPLGALEVCSQEAIPLTREVQAGFEPSISLKRTSFRYRNPANAPDEGEEAALLFFERAIQDGSGAPPHMVQRYSEEEMRYYQPLFTGEMCLGCHGDPASLDPDVVQALSDRYPRDLATGYEAGDFRGVVRVSMPASVLEGSGS
jgi:hypothetical protein